MGCEAGEDPNLRFGLCIEKARMEVGIIRLYGFMQCLCLSN